MQSGLCCGTQCEQLVSHNLIEDFVDMSVIYVDSFVLWLLTEIDDNCLTVIL